MTDQKLKTILAVDPGVRKLGYALISSDMKILDAGIILQDKKSPTRDDQFMRMQNIYEFFVKMSTQIDIDVFVIEKLFFTEMNQSNAEFVYGVRGMLIALMLDRGASIKEFTPIELKKYITGNGKADKMFVQKMIMKIFQLENLPLYNDAADALGLAYLGIKVK